MEKDYHPGGHWAPTFIHLTSIKNPIKGKFLYKVKYTSYDKYYYSDEPNVRDFMIHCKDTIGSTKVEYMGKVFPDD